MEFVEHKSGNPSAVPKIGAVTYCLYRQVNGPDGQTFYMLWPNGMGCIVEKQGTKESHALCVGAKTPENAWELAKQDKNLMQKFGIDPC